MAASRVHKNFNGQDVKSIWEYSGLQDEDADIVVTETEVTIPIAAKIDAFYMQPAKRYRRRIIYGYSKHDIRGNAHSAANTYYKIDGDHEATLEDESADLDGVTESVDRRQIPDNVFIHHREQENPYTIPQCDKVGCVAPSGHNDQHQMIKLCSTKNCTAFEGHKGLHFNCGRCPVVGCTNKEDHTYQHKSLRPCPTEICTRWDGHLGPHCIREKCSLKNCSETQGHTGEHQFSCNFERCVIREGHSGPHELVYPCVHNDCAKRRDLAAGRRISTRCPLEGCDRRHDHSGPHEIPGAIPHPLIHRPPLMQRPCFDSRCDRPEGHPGSHSSLGLCHVRGCCGWAGHLGPHEMIPHGFESNSKEVTTYLKKPEALLIEAAIIAYMMLSPAARWYQPQQQLSNTLSVRHSRTKVTSATSNTGSANSLTSYSDSKLSNDRIRLFELQPANGNSGIYGSFHDVELSSYPSYIALSYTWGTQTSKRTIVVNDGHAITIGQNLWQFLQHQASIITRPRVFWIDAICIDQENVHERNHQIGLMSKIYTMAAEVFIWLGDASEDSDLAMDFLVNQATKTLQTRGLGYHDIWTRAVGEALCTLCERDYWRRMWIIQELIHARNITVWCGKKHFEWNHLEALYVKLKTIEDAGWSAHHPYHVNVLQSSAATMIWQRAHYRHPDTPAPRLQSLIGIFRDWQCTDVRDKVFALVGLATADSQIVPDYDMSAKAVYLAVMHTVDRDTASFANLLSQTLGLPGADVELWDQSLIEYKTAPAQQLVVTASLTQYW